MAVSFTKKTWKNRSDPSLNPDPTVDPQTQASEYNRIEQGIADTAAEVNAHEALTSTAHGGIVTTSDARLADKRVPLDGSVGAAQLAAGGVTTPKLADSAVTDIKLDGTAPGFLKAVAGVITRVTALVLTDIPDALITAAKLAASLKPSGTASDATEALRALGYTAKLAAPGVDIGSGAKGGFTDVDGRLDDFDTRISAIPAGAPGANGKTEWAWATDPTVSGGAFVVGQIYEAWPAGVAKTIVGARATVNIPGSGRTTIDIQTCPDLNPPGGTSAQVWTSIWDADSSRVQIVGGQALGISGVAPSRPSIPAVGGARAAVLEASASGGTPGLDTGPVSGGNNSTADQVLTAPAYPAALTDGDIVIVAVLANTGTPTEEPAQLSNLAGALQPYVKITSGASHQMWAYLYRHTWNHATSDPTTWHWKNGATAIPVEYVAVGVQHATLDLTASKTKVQDSGGFTLATPTGADGVPSVPDGALLLYFAFTKTTGTGTPPSPQTLGTRSWDGGMANDVSQESTRATTQNYGICVAHELKSGSGVPIARNMSWVNDSNHTAYRMSVILVFDPGSTAPADGIVVLDVIDT